MERNKLWIWLLIAVLITSSIGMGMWLGLNKELVQYAKDNGVLTVIKQVVSNGDVGEGTELVVEVQTWDEKFLFFDFVREGRLGSFKIDFKKTGVVLMVPGLQEGEMVEHDLLSTLSPYWKDAFCPGDSVVLELKDSAVGLKEQMVSIRSSDVVKITNLGPSKCRRVN